VSNTRPRDPAVVAGGNERVLNARLADASFFFEEDKKVPLEDRVESLKKVVFHTLLGTSHKKVLRFRKLAVKIAAKVKPSVKKNVDRARFCKGGPGIADGGRIFGAAGHHGARIRASCR
jgi:glycyl-tRNA synthetase beta chain